MRRSERRLSSRFRLHQLGCLARDTSVEAGGLPLAQMFAPSPPSLAADAQQSRDEPGSNEPPVDDGASSWTKPPVRALNRKRQISCSRWISIKATSSLMPPSGPSPRLVMLGGASSLTHPPREGFLGCYEKRQQTHPSVVIGPSHCSSANKSPLGLVYVAFPCAVTSTLMHSSAYMQK